jgi:hypothetical protein
MGRRAFGRMKWQSCGTLLANLLRALRKWITNRACVYQGGLSEKFERRGVTYAETQPNWMSFRSDGLRQGCGVSMVLADCSGSSDLYHHADDDRFWLMRGGRVRTMLNPGHEHRQGRYFGKQFLSVPFAIPIAKRLGTGDDSCGIESLLYDAILSRLSEKL